ncbi:hypothetical protein RUM44_013472 [Polyplax serrata]|uniref:t-SNARE coiled-coil homology domain-containing protein n=1 Tax=Polyplax serrata TaxID=468196 RepID=A0ABR1BIF0_POLSC
MAVRSLTDVFTLMRNNAIQNRNFYNDQAINDRAALVDQGDYRHDVFSGLPPAWTDQLEECQYTITRLNSKIQELDNLHKKNLHRPTLNDTTEDQHQIEVLTRDISRMFNTCHKLLSTIKKQSQSGNSTERNLAKNVLSSLAVSLQNSSNAFRRTQNNYLKTLDLREERSKQYLNVLDQGYDSSLMDNDSIDQVFGRGPAYSMTQQQLLLLEEDNLRLAEKREEEVKQIVKSIVDLNQIYKDLAQMVTHQGTVLDRIDYNIERTSVQVHEGFQQLEKAERYQKKNRKMSCIICLAATVLFMFILLVVVKLN